MRLHLFTCLQKICFDPAEDGPSKIWLHLADYLVNVPDFSASFCIIVLHLLEAEGKRTALAHGHH